jgi:hypothetical protein
MIQARVFRFFLLLMGSHGDVLGKSVEADGKKASAVHQALLLNEEATPFLKKGPPWPDLEGASAIYSGPGPPKLLVSEDKEVRTNEWTRHRRSSSFEAIANNPLPSSLLFDATLLTTARRCEP